MDLAFASRPTALPAATPTATAPVRAASLPMLMQGLHQVADAIGRGDAAAGPALQSLIAQLGHHPDPRATGLMVFAAAMARRLTGGDEVANLYLRRFEVPQIELFNLLGRQVPTARMATRLANDGLAQAIRGEAHPVLIDVGIGTGRQFAQLLDELAAAGALGRQLTVIGIEPAADALAIAGQVLAAQAERLGVALRFHGFAATAEALGDAEWQAIAALCASRPAINAAFALHHIADDAAGGDQRNRVLARLAALRPRCLVLAEPEVDHLEPRYATRFANCLAHFGAVFSVLDALPLQQAERDALKVGFFGREVHDVLGTADTQRRERHEPAAAWIRRLQASGFAVARPPVTPPSAGHPSVQAQVGSTHALITGGGQPLVSVLFATPAAA